MSKSNPTIIIKKVKKIASGKHHGGSWKKQDLKKIESSKRVPTKRGPTTGEQIRNFNSQSAHSIQSYRLGSIILPNAGNQYIHRMDQPQRSGIFQ